MTTRNLWLAAAAATLAACGGDAGDSPSIAGWQQAEVYYSYPYDGQQNLSPKTPLVLRFSHAMAVDASHFTLLDCGQLGDACEDTGDNQVALGDPQSLDGGMGVMLQPQSPLQSHSHYRLVIDGIETDQGSPVFPDGGLDFVTRLSHDGPLSTRMATSDLAVSQVIPDGNALPFMDFSTLRVRFNQMLDPGTMQYGDTDGGASVELEHEGDTVPAALLVKGNAVTIDPLQDLTPGQRYTLKFTPSVRGVDQAQLTGGFEQSWTARDSMPRATLVQEALSASEDQNDPCNAPDALVAKLTGATMNCVPIQSTLLGDKDATMQTGDVFAELAYLPNYPQVSPLRIPRNSLLTGTNVTVKVAGEVAAGIDTGAIAVTFLSDASGYLLPNPYSDAHEAPKQVKLYMDVSMTAENPEANGALSQTLLHVELNGMALVKEGRMEIDAVGIVEPKVLGQETAFGLLSFHMKSYEDQENAPQPVPDMTAPQLQSMVPAVDESGTALSARPGDAVILNFDEPLDPSSLSAGDTFGLQQDGSHVAVDWYLDGASLVMRPVAPLAFGESYTAMVSSRVTDLAGNPAVPVNASFNLPQQVGDLAPPIVLTSYPGFPCAADKAHWEIEAGNHGFCQGGKVEDDRNPVPSLPTDRAIRVNFSRDIDAESVVFENTNACDVGSFRVEKVELDPATGRPLRYDEDGKRKYRCEAGVTGKLEVGNRRLVFTPSQPWEEGAYYRYILMSVNQTSAQQPDDCRSGEAICATDGKRLQTALLRAPDSDMGGPDMHLHFVAGAPVASVFQPLKNLPTADLNGNGHFDAGEPGYNGGEPGANTTALIIDESKGDNGSEGGVSDPALVCDLPEQCGIHVVGGLNSEVIGATQPYDDPSTPDVEAWPAVRIGLYPTLIQASSVTLKVKIIGLFDSDTPTETQFMRMRYQCVAWPEDADNFCGKKHPDGSFVYDEWERQGLIPGWIVQTPEGPEFRADVDLYLDAPYMHILLDGTHNQHSYPLTMNLAGPVTFLPDGRMVIEQLNSNDIAVDVNLSVLILNLKIYLKIPAGGVKLQYLGEPIKQ
ncbi:Ig-like domain-containing protein [uncultured Alcanivorax sp.]|uniref:Ig-like domain-containing protein n=1 Tax=uncultured Alcanivorax sp. TaxID=191215 RepID=UPI002630DBA7|nr:Ig-like domain-containing protein [uncultured Alcanivorax sp.]